MADYYPVLKKTVAALPENTGAARREIYQRARKAIVAQLKAYDPPLSPSEITSEQLRLEESIRKVEAEAARETLGFSASQQPVATPRPTAPQPAAAPKPPQPAARPAATDTPAQAASPAAPARPAPAPSAAPAARAPAAAEPPRDTLKSAIEEARKLGDAADQAGRSARGALDGEPARTAPPKREPTLGSDPSIGDDTAGRGSSARGNRLPTPARDNGRSLPYDGDLRPSRLPAILGGVALLLLVVGIGAIGYSQRDTLMSLFAGDDSETPTSQPTATTGTDTPAPASDTGTDGASASRKDTARLLDGPAPDARPVTTTRITPNGPQTDTLAPSAPAAGQDSGGVRTVEPQEPASAQPDAAETTEEPDVVETPQDTTAETPADTEPQQEQDTQTAATTPAQPDPTAASDAPVAQRAILYEEGATGGSAGQASAGRSVWSVTEETIDGRVETVLRMRIEVPDRNIAANLTLKPNRDETLPASHLLEVQFELPEGFSGQGVAEVPGLVMKTTEEARGDALIGASVKVADGYFWVALSNLPDEQERNLTLLRDRGWIDIPMLYENGKRAILTLEKGTPGTRAVQQATDAWRAG
ncbi:hypothetical protein [Stappia indica]|uniref:CheA signal transduction histidine kinase n=1 Tax=Stappia indica TaxID=538381 RepID=A0A857C8I9_9HYPH|nr:hypothetical protein [Stappia indica]QGZ34822.1 hypothetical protein GH266_10000 [Stappia indica]